MRLANRALEHLPVAVTVIDSTLAMHYWNLHAASLLNLPPMMQDDTPGLADALRGGDRLSLRQVSRILAFCDAGIDAHSPVPQSCLRISLSRQHRLVVKLHAIGGDRWILGFEEPHPLGQAFRAGDDAMVDSLTGLSNRRHFNECLLEKLPENGSEGRVAVLLIDLDRFQAVNDTLGRAVGDALLSLVAQRLKRETRDEDVVARLGGDAFAILQPDAEAPEALARRVVEMIASPFLVEGQVVNMGASVGIARAPDHGSLVDQLVKHADIALYAAKAAGGQTWRMFGSELAHRATMRRGLETDLRNAMALGELWLAYRPQCESATRRMTGFSVSPRWTNPGRGAVPGSVFLPLAEEIGCLTDLREWVLKAACADAARWPVPLRVSAAVSAPQLDDPDRLFETVRGALAASGLAPQRLEIDLDGTALMACQGPVVELIHRLHGLGIGVAMTGFGAGWSSLRQLRAFAFDRVKVDPSLVAALHSDPETVAMVRAIATLAGDLGMAVLAEGVETAEQAAILVEQGCTVLEGSLVGDASDAIGVAGLLRGPVGA
jgi:diguanylate cyclase (GGDEF)-like protein